MAKPKTVRIDKGHNKTSRALELLIRLKVSKLPVRVSELVKEEWGHERTISRLVDGINEVWESRTGAPLVEVVKTETAGLSDKLLIMRDELPGATSLASLIHLPAVKSFLANLEGSVLVDQIENRLSRSHATLSPVARTKLDHIGRKFVYVSKGQVQYNLIPDILDTVLDALVLEKKISVVVSRETGPKNYVLLPLGLLWMNSNLYLAAIKQGGPEQEAPRTWALEGLLEVERLKEGFVYPKGLDLHQYFDKGFGLLRDEKIHKVELAFENRYDIHRTLRYRTFGKDQTLSVEDDVLMLRFTTDNLSEITSWILGWSDLVEVQSPQILRDMIKERLEAALSYYQKSS